MPGKSENALHFLCAQLLAMVLHHYIPGNIKKVIKQLIMIDTQIITTNL